MQEPETPIKQTALQLWNSELRSQLELNALAKPTKNLILPIKLHYEKVMKAISIAETFEVTKQRVIVDKILADLNQLAVELIRTPKWRILRRIKISNQLVGYKASLLLVVNTIPPLQDPKIRRQPSEPPAPDEDQTEGKVPEAKEVAMSPQTKSI